uniref:Gypsy retrotransposon integrase-like protein 1 n=1 Tax=Pelodiscus sinensis TaxID=13735 RepID=K7EXH9_PELSI
MYRPKGRGRLRATEVTEMDAGKLLEWLADNQRQQQQQQTQLLQQMAEQQKEQQRLVRELMEQQQGQVERWLQAGSRGPTGATTEGAGVGAALALPLRLVKMTPSDDPEAFLITFERVATAARWPEENWATLLAPYLTGAAQGAYRGLAARDALHYHKVKEAILDQAGITPETHRQRFRTEKYRPGERPRAVVQRLKEAAMRWLEPERKSSMQVVEMVVLDQFLQILPPDSRLWVRRHQPTTLGEATSILENYMAAAGGEERVERGPEGPGGRGERGRARPSRARGGWGAPPIPWKRWGEPSTTPPPGPPKENLPREKPAVAPRPPEAPTPGACFECGQEGHFRRDCPFMDCSYGRALMADQRARSRADDKITVQVGVAGKEVWALVDTGCNQTMVREALLPRGGTMGPTIAMQCIHGDVKHYPTQWVLITEGGQQRRCRVAVAPGLAYPVVLGRDWPGLTRLLQEWGKVHPTQAERAESRPHATTPPREAQAGDTPSIDDRGRATADDHEFVREQCEDESLKHAWEQAGNTAEPDRTGKRGPRFEVRDDRLYRVVCPPEQRGEVWQLLVPARRRWRVLEAAHANPWAGHLGSEKTLQRILQRFYWPGVHKETRDFCDSCPECQRVAGKSVARAPLVPLPVVDVPFRRIALDLVGPLERSRKGNRYILVLIDYATRYPEAVPLRSTKAPVLAEELVKVFSRVGLPQEILTDQGTNLTGRVLAELCRLLRVKQLRTSVYHPQTDGLVERFNRTLKTMLRKFIELDPRDWDQFLPALLFAVREVPQASTGFSPFELLYGRQPRGILDLIKEEWEEQPPKVQGMVPYILGLRERLRAVGELAQGNLRKAQARQARYYNRGAQVRTFAPGERVLLLLPSAESKLLAKWQGPYEVIRQVGPVDYEIKLPDRRKGAQIYHVNLLKRWREREGLMVSLQKAEPELGPWGGDIKDVEEEAPLGAELTEPQREGMRSLLREFADVLSTQPGKTTAGYHHIQTPPGQKIREPLRPLPRKMWDPVQEEVSKMLRMGVIRESRSAWRSPIVLVPKRDGTLRFCIDFRKVNAISRMDAYPMPRVEELLERLGRAQYLSTLDLTKGYWQIPLTPTSQAKTAFATPSGLYHFITMPFGLNGAAATFQRVMDQVLRDHQAYAAAYIDDIIIFSASWEEHLTHVRAVLQALKEARLTANPAKCTFGQAEVAYLGYVVGRGHLRPQVNKIAAVQNYRAPTTKKQVRQFLGLAGYYRRFIPQFATIATPLTDLTRKGYPEKVKWTERCEEAFQQLKQRLTSAPVLTQPDFTKPFIVQTDASNLGVGAVLAQDQGKGDRPIVYLSRKLLPREQQYSTIEKEALALRWAVEMLRYYLWGNTFRLVTDHAPLTWMHNMKEVNPRVMRWYLFLQQYSFIIVHRAGREHSNVDFLSRCVEREEVKRETRETRGEGCDGGTYPRTP